MRVSAGLFFICALALQTGNGSAACNAAAQKGVPQLGADTRVDIDASGSVAAGKPVTIGWRRGQFSDRYPAYLMVAFDGPVRFDGAGFYVLLPGARAAFGISSFADRTRAVIPYYGRGVPLDGKFAVVPLQAGTLNVEWTVVGYDGCKEIVADGGRGSVTISVGATGAPEIVVNDFAAEEPSERIYSPAAGRVVEVHDGRYRLVDEETGAEIAERVGTRPRFSPTGRFLAAYAEDGIEILDTVDGKPVYRDSVGRDLAWDSADSFAILNRGAWGMIVIVAPSFENRVVLQGQGSCHACGGTDNTAVRIDLENNVAALNGDQGAGVASLTVDAKLDLGIMNNNDIRRARQDLLAFVKRQSQVTAYALPKRWELNGGLKFSNLSSEGTEFSSSDPLTKFLVKPRFLPVAAVEESRAGSIRVAQWRGLAPKGAVGVERLSLGHLEALGLPSMDAKGQSPATFAREVMVFSKDAEGALSADEEGEMQAVGRLIEKEIPGARGVFGQKAYSTGCYVEASFDQTTLRYTQILDTFQRAFKFQRDGRVIWITHYQCKEGSAGFDHPTLALFDSALPQPWFLHDETGDPDSNVGTVCYANIASCDFDARIFGGRYLLLFSTLSRAIEVFDLDARRNVFRRYNLPRGDLLQEALISSDYKLVLQINSDGSFAGFRLEDAAPLFEGRYVDDEVVVWTPDGRFDATSEGAHYVNLRLPGRVGTYTFEQFSAQLKTPGLVQRLAAGETFPAVNLVSPPSLKGTFEVDGDRVLGTAEVAADTRVASLLVFQDGLMTDKLDKNVGADWDFDVGLLPGTRWVSLVAVDEAGLASLPMGRDLPPLPGMPRRVHLLAVGVDNYDDPAIPDLGLAVSDAERFAKAIETIGGDVRIASSRVLDERAATREGVLAALREVLAAAGSGETVVLFFAGHGVTTSDGAYFLATADTAINDIAGSALPWEEVAVLLREKEARIAVFLDTCHSGAAGTGAFSTNDGAAASLLERIPSGIVVFSASKGRELSEEAAAVGGGVFTSALVDAITGNRDRFDENGNGAIEISELYRGVKAVVKAGTEGRQTPWIARNQMVGDFALF
jgi:hypothetical protein